MEVKSKKSPAGCLTYSLFWISSKSIPAGLPAAESLSMNTKSGCSQSSLTGEEVVFLPISCVLWLWLCGCAGCCQQRGRGGGECPLPSPILPGQIRQRVCEKEEEEEVDRDHVSTHLSLPSLPPAPYKPHCTPGMGDTPV